MWKKRKIHVWNVVVLFFYLFYTYILCVAYGYIVDGWCHMASNESVFIHMH